jgi:DnaJ-class molecular chaperone
MKTVTCPYCEGDGMVDDYADDMFGNSTKFSHGCECCDGEGEIPEEEYKSAKEVYIKTNREVIAEIEGEEL